VNSPPDRLSLAELQARFAAALRVTGAESADAIASLAECVVDDGLAPGARAQVYRNNSRAMFVGALERTYPVLRQWLGVERFGRLSQAYRAEHPSRSGDLHWVGAALPSWLETRVAGGDEAWLADLARLEWACETALVAERRPAMDPQALEEVPAEDLADTGLALQPCLQTVSSAYPIWSAWRKGQSGDSDERLAPAPGAQHVVVTCSDDGLVLHSVPEERFRFVAALAIGATLSGALECAGADPGQLPVLLAWLFAEGLVVGVRQPASDCA
jgi:hypothetical protein